MNTSSTCSLDCFYDYADTTNHALAGDTFSLSSTTKRTRVAKSLNGGYQREAYAAQIRIYGSSTTGGTFHSLTLNVVALTQIQVGRAYDWDNLGWPFDKKLNRLVMEYDIPVGSTVVMNLDTMSGINGVQQENTAVQTFTLSPPTTTTLGTPNRIFANFSVADNTVAKLVRMRPTVGSVQFKHFGYTFPDLVQYPPDVVEYTEWGVEGYPYQKELVNLEVEVNTNGVNCTLQVQGDGANLGSPFTINTTINDRVRVLSFPPNLVAKNIRLHFTPGAGGMAQYFRHNFEVVKYPPDSQQYTDWDDVGYAPQKKLQTALIEMNTNGVDCAVTFQGESGQIGPTVTMNTTVNDRVRMFDFSTPLIAKKFRLQFTPGTGGVAQFWRVEYGVFKYPADSNQYEEWNDSGYPHQKELQTLELEANSFGVPSSVQVWGDGVAIGTPNTITTTLDDRTREISFPNGIIAKLLMLKFTPSVQYFRHLFTYIQYPPEIVRFTEWQNYDYPCEKTLRSLQLNMNTNGAPCTVQIQGDGANLGPPITFISTLDTRQQIISLPSGLSAKMFRLQFTPTFGAFSQYWGHSFDFVKEPCAVTHWDSLEFNFNYDGYNFLKQIWLQYQCSASITVSIYVDNGVLFKQIVLPPHAQRDIERFYLEDHIGSVLNKSKRKRITIDSTLYPFKLYVDGSRVEWLACGSDQRQGYQQAPISTIMAPAI
jgi:hypothetical protein